MKNGLLICAGTAKNKNIGDFIQSLASEQYLDQIDYYVEREELNTFSSENPAKVIMNGWFMWNPQNWPPSNDIKPLFVSFHIVPGVADQMLTPEGIEYLQKYSPIGCRDFGTVKLLREHNIPSYFSGCLTLTLGKTYYSNKKNNRIVFVDPYYESSLRSKKELLKIGKIVNDLFHLIKNYKIILSISKRFHHEFRSGYRKISQKLDKLVQVASFYRSYSTIFSDELLINAEYLGHNISQSIFHNDIEKLEYARKLMKTYSESSLVITSRIHCALPCLGVETPVLFVTSDNLESQNAIRSPGRFGGIMELFHSLKYTYNRMEISDFQLKKTIGDEKISTNSISIKNKIDYKVLRDEMDKTCTNFIKGTKL